LPKRSDEDIAGWIVAIRIWEGGYEAHADAVGAWNVSFAISGLAEAA
jgi:hypothetical protein